MNRKGITIAVSEADISVLRGALELAKRTEASAIALGPSARENGWLEEGISMVRNQGLPVITYSERFEVFVFYGSGSPEITLDYAKFAKNAGANGVMGFLNTEQRGEIIEFAMKSELCLILGAEDHSQHLIDYKAGVRNFLIGSNPMHLADMRQMITPDAVLWIIVTGRDTENEALEDKKLTKALNSAFNVRIIMSYSKLVAETELTSAQE